MVCAPVRCRKLDGCRIDCWCTAGCWCEHGDDHICSMHQLYLNTHRVCALRCDNGWQHDLVGYAQQYGNQCNPNSCDRCRGSSTNVPDLITLKGTRHGSIS